MVKAHKALSRDGVLRLRAVPDEMLRRLGTVDVELALERRQETKVWALLYK